VLVEFTDAGWALRDRVAGVPNALMSSLDLSTREAEQLRRLLRKVLTHLDR